MAELTRLVRPTQPQVGLSPSPKECHSEGLNYPTFRQLNKKSRVLLSPQYLSTDQNFVYRDFVISNKRGWFAAIQNNTGTFGAILSPLSDLRKSMKEATSDASLFVPQRTISFSTSEPNLLAFACNDSRLIVGFKSGQIIAYDTSSVLTPGSNDIPPSYILQSSQQPILDITANPNNEDPNLSNLLAVVRTDGAVQLLNSNLEPQGGWIAGDADSSPAVVAWSPKGKQLAIGLRQGDILTFTLDARSSPQRHIPPTTQGTLVSLNWLAPGHTFRTTYAASEPIHHIVYSEKRTSPIMWTRLEHSFQIPDRTRQNSYSAVLPKWDGQADDRLLIVVGDMSCTDLEVLGNTGSQWYQQSQENPLSIPLDKESEDTVLLSLQVDFTDTDPTEGGHPIVYAYLNDGTLQGWYVDHPEKQLYAGMLGSAANVSPSILAFSQQQNSNFGSQPSSFDQTSPSFGHTPAAPTTGQPSAGQTSFGGQPATEPTLNFGSSSSSSGFANFASNSASPFGIGGFASTSPNQSGFGNATVESSPQITRDASMSDSTPTFGGLSLGDSSESSKPKSSFGGTGGMFGSPSPLPLPPTHPANNTSQTSVFGSGGGSLIKPATGFGAFGGSSTGNFGAFGNTSNPVSNAFNSSTFGTQPTQPSTFASNTEQPKSGSGFGQSGFGQASFGQPSFGKSSFGQPTFGQSSFGTKQTNPTSGGFGAFAQTPTSFTSAFSSSPASKSDVGGGGFASFAGTPSTFSTATSSGNSVFSSASAPGTKDTTEQKSDGFSEFASKVPSPFGQTDQKPSSFGNKSSSSGAFSNFASNGPSVFGQPAPMSGGSVFEGPKSASPTVFGQVGAFGGLKSTSPSAFGQPAPSTSGNASSNPSVFVTSMGGSDKDQPATVIKSEPGSPTLPSSPDSDTSNVKPSPLPVQLPPTTGSAFGNLQTSSFTLKPATGFGAFGNTMSSSSPFLKPNTDNEKPAVSAFGSLASVKPALPSITSLSTGPTFGATSQLGFGFGLKPSVSTPSPTTPSVTSSTATTSAFSAFSGTPSPFTAVGGGTIKSFGDLLKEGKAEQMPEAGTKPPSDSLSVAVIKKIDDDTHKKEKTSVEEKEKGKVVEDPAKEESSSSTSSSFVEIPRSSEHEGDEEEEVPNSDDELEQHGLEDGDFLSESYGSQSGDEQSEEGESEEVDAKEYLEGPSPSSSPEPTEIPLPPSRSRSNTPHAEIPTTDSTSPSPESSEDTESSHLSTIREESTTPPGSPTRTPTAGPSGIVSPAPISAPLTSLGIGRPSTRPTKSSPLANKPLTGIDEDEEQQQEEVQKLNAPIKPRPASPKTPFGVIPSKSRSTSPEESKLNDGKRPKTPPLLSNLIGTTSAPTTPKPAAANLSNFITLSKSPAEQTLPLSIPPAFEFPSSSSSSNNLFSKPFSLQPATSGTDPGIPKISSVFTPPSSGFSGNATPKPDSRGTLQLPLATFSTPYPPGTPPIFSTGTSRSPLPLPSPFTPPPIAETSTSSTPVGPIRSPGTIPAPPSIENGMQRECHMLVDVMHTELERLRVLAGVVAKKRGMLSKSAGGSRQKEDLGNHEKWAPCDGAQFGALLRQFEQDIFELKAFAEKQKEDIRDIGKSMIKAGTRREEIARFNKARSDNEFSKMLKSRTLGPEHLENQMQLRRNIRAMHTKVDQLEDQLRAHKKRLSEVNSGRPTLKPPSLDTIHRTYRNIDIALQQQTDEVAQLNTRFLKLNLAAYSPVARDPRLPSFSPRSRPSIITPDVAVTTAAALNAERSAHKLKTMLLKTRKEPLLNVRAREATEGGKKVPTAYMTPKSSSGPPLMDSGAGIQFATPVIRGPLFGGTVTPSSSAPDTGNWDALSFPEDNFHISTPMSAGGRRGGTPQRKHGPAPSVKKSPAPGSPEVPKASSPGASFDWGPLPIFNKPSPGLPGFDKVTTNSPSLLPLPSVPQPNSFRLGINPPSFSSVFDNSSK
ncbi:hypothetical protein J3R30DRAFT_3435653 [Lentinula aciculospora]|uniref:Nucleoporin Nup159/Nup146 N-terminal domain-containing protein n=1 Tax=Lentinula aciculospora TaxID=153920 RepID=A0A9W9AQK4_9AGAR|nr:hypothetical protein J3R30DRAFT_3435653 [Lentinula aciculospora]